MESSDKQSEDKETYIMSIERNLNSHPALTPIIRHIANDPVSKKVTYINKFLNKVVRGYSDEGTRDYSAGNMNLYVVQCDVEGKFVELVLEYSNKNGGDLSVYLFNGAINNDSDYQFDLETVQNVTDDYDEFGEVDSDW